MFYSAFSFRVSLPSLISIISAIFLGSLFSSKTSLPVTRSKSVALNASINESAEKSLAVLSALAIISTVSYPKAANKIGSFFFFFL